MCCWFEVCEYASRLHSLTDEFVQHVSSVRDIVSDLADTFLICCVVVVVACVADKLLLRMLRACAMLPVRVTYIVTHECAHQLDVGEPSLTDTQLYGQSCDGRPFTCRDALLSSPLTDLHLPQFSETKV